MFHQKDVAGELNSVYLLEALRVFMMQYKVMGLILERAFVIFQNDVTKCLAEVTQGTKGLF